MWLSGTPRHWSFSQTHVIPLKNLGLGQIPRESRQCRQRISYKTFTSHSASEKRVTFVFRIILRRSGLRYKPNYTGDDGHTCRTEDLILTGAERSPLRFAVWSSSPLSSKGGPLQDKGLCFPPPYHSFSALLESILCLEIP